MRSIDNQHTPAEAPSAFVIRLEGEFDLAESRRLTDAFAIATSASLVIVDLGRTEYIDSSVLECLVALHNTLLKRGTELVLVGLNHQVKRLFQVTELEKFFTIRDSIADKIDIPNAEVRRLTIEARPID